MRSSFHNALLQEETRYKDAVYHALDEEIQAAKENVSDKCAEVRRGAYEAQDSQITNCSVTASGSAGNFGGIVGLSDSTVIANCVLNESNINCL